MRSNSQGPDNHDNLPDSHDSDRNLRYRPNEPPGDEPSDDFDDELDEIYNRPSRVADGWAEEPKSETAWWVKAGIALVSIMVVLGLIAGMAGPFFGGIGSNNSQPTIEYVPAQVLEMLDVRTIVAEIDGERVTVRYIGVQPLPTDSLWYPVGPLANQQLVAGAEVLLEADEIDTDEFGRLLRYVYVNRNMINGVLIRNGIALLGDEQEGLNRHHYNLKGWSEAAQFEELGHWSGQPPQSILREDQS